MSELVQIIKELLKPGKGLEAMDASNPTMTKRMEALGITSTAESRRDFRELLVTTPGLSEYISGAILYDETIRQKLSDGLSFVEALQKQGIIPGIKVDKGTKDMAGFPGEKIAEGIDGLAERLIEYKKMGAKFAKFRTVIAIGKTIPTKTCIDSNSEIQARYAEACQETDIVPVVEPEVLMEGDHNIQKSEEANKMVLDSVFRHLRLRGVSFENMILKASWVHPGLDAKKPSSEEVAEATVGVLASCVPTDVPGIVFLSGGDSPKDASGHLNAIAKREDDLPWEITFSFERALEGPAMEIWSGKEENKSKAQEALLERAKANALASSGKL